VRRQAGGSEENRTPGKWRSRDLAPGGGTATSCGGAGGNSSDGSRISHSDDRSPPSPVVGAARGPACGEASHCNYKSQL